MTVGNGIQSAHPTVGGRELKLQFIIVSSDEALIQIWVTILVCRWFNYKREKNNQRARIAEVVTPLNNPYLFKSGLSNP